MVRRARHSELRRTPIAPQAGTATLKTTLKETAMKLATALAASILSLTTLDAQAAGPTDDAFSLTVQFGDLDLNREAGIAKLYLRIKGAARHVCYQQAEEQPDATQSYPACVKRAVATAVARIDRPMLSAYAAQLSGKPTETALASVSAR
jgi:UrcA family protein